MPSVKPDVVIEAVHYGEDSQVDWVRVYKRIGTAYTDRLILDRDALIKSLKSGEKVYAGKRIPLLAGSFELGEQIRLIERDGKSVLAIGSAQPERDDLSTIPVL